MSDVAYSPNVTNAVQQVMGSNYKPSVTPSLMNTQATQQAGRMGGLLGNYTPMNQIARPNNAQPMQSASSYLAPYLNYKAPQSTSNSMSNYGTDYVGQMQKLQQQINDMKSNFSNLAPNYRVNSLGQLIYVQPGSVAE